MKRQHENPEFDHERGEIFEKNLQKKEKSTVSFNSGEAQKTIINQFLW
jgi:hypothetical protein